MEKISHIVSGSARVGATDLKHAAPVRPGAPSFGRPVGESPHGREHKFTTAQKATAIQDEMNKQKKIHEQAEMVQRMADQFFVRSMHEPMHADALASIPGKSDLVPSGDQVHLGDDDLKTGSAHIAESAGAPEAAVSKYTPRGSLINVQA